MKNGRTAGAEKLSEKIKEIGFEAGLNITRCEWDIGEDVEHAYAHRLDIYAGTETVRLYFTDLELMAEGNDSRRAKTETALQNAVSQLAGAARAPTYSFGRVAATPLTVRSEQNSFNALIRNNNLVEDDFQIEEINTPRPESVESIPNQRVLTVFRKSTRIEKKYAFDGDLSWLLRFKNDLEHGLFD